MRADECMATIPYRLAKAYEAWYKQQWNQPSRTDFYIMQVAQEVKRVLATSPNSIKLKHFLLDFFPFAKQREIEEKRKKMTPAEIKAEKKRLSQLGKAIWLARMGGGKAKEKK